MSAAGERHTLDGTKGIQMTTRCLAICMVILASGGTSGGNVSAQTPAVDRERAAIEAMYKTRLQAILGVADPAKTAEAYVRDITDDAVWMPPSVPPVRGKQAVLGWARDFFGKYELQVDAQDIEPLEIGGTIAIRRFTSTGRYVPRAGGAAVPFDQKYIDVLRRGSDGAWRLSLHMWSSNNSGQTIWR